MTTSGRSITAAFQVTAWEETAYDKPSDGAKLTRATVHKRFSGALEGTSVAEVLTAQGDGGRGYIASERVEGTLDGRSGTFVIQHGGVDDNGALRSFGHVVPGCGSGELAELRGDAAFTHDASGARVTITFDI